MTASEAHWDGWEHASSTGTVSSGSGKGFAGATFDAGAMGMSLSLDPPTSQAPDRSGMRWGLVTGAGIAAVLASVGAWLAIPSEVDVFVVTKGDDIAPLRLAVVGALRDDGYRVECDHQGRSAKAQVNLAKKRKARLAVNLMQQDDGKTAELFLEDLSNWEKTPILDGPLDLSTGDIRDAAERARLRTAEALRGTP